MATVCTLDLRQCTRCQEWKHLSCFHDYDGRAMLPESRHVCRDCFPVWLDEEWARERGALH